ncbi:MAG: DUF6431 domain-containing protein [Acidimicrobiales bacterium]
MSIVWPCSLSLDAYVKAGRSIDWPRPDCPACGLAMSFWSGYRRHVRAAGRAQAIFVPRVRCRSCAVSHALLPAFLLVNRLDVVDTIGEVIDEVASGRGGVRPPAERAGVPHTTARGWWRRFRARAERIAVGFAALAVELGGATLAPLGNLGAWAMAAMADAWEAAARLAGWATLGCWHFVSAVSGGALLATNTSSPWFVIGKRRFIPPVP